MVIRAIYTLLLFIASPYFMWKLYKKKDSKPSVGTRWKEHFGFTPPLETEQSPIWIHAASVGETLAVSPLIKALKSQYPDKNIVITTTTPTGAEQARKLQGIATHRYMPFDFSFAIRGFLDAIKPSQLLIMETELWPNTLHTVSKHGIPITVINARLSERSYQRYVKIKPVFEMLEKNLTQVLCQYSDDAERFIRLGVAKEKISITGSLKFDIEINKQIIHRGKALRKQLGYNRPIWIAASTHNGEDEKILAAHKNILKVYNNALLILVPRHPERFNNVFNLSNNIFNTARRTVLNNKPLNEGVQVYLGDTMGEMLVLMGASDVCFIGGSLLGDKVGGHNMLEPSALSKPIITGNSYYNFLAITEELKKNNAIIIIRSPEELSASVSNFFSNSSYRKVAGENSHFVFLKYSGAILSTIDKINLHK
ncbi:MAG: lipid IV(A) 3-deoxy-D-manno-octulosonic acid transferase [Shewanella sp.]